MPTLISNARLRYDYEILDNFTAGIVLTGAEVKACKRGDGSLQGAYVTLEQGEVWLKQMRINPYQVNNQRGYDPLRPRKLLLKHAEVQQLIGKLAQAGLTLLPESLYTKGALIKVNVALARGKKKYDKRATIKKRDANRRIARALRQHI